MPYPTGSCRECGAVVTDASRCPACRRKRREREAELRESRRKAKKCITCGESVVRGRRYCAAHLSYYAARARASD